MSLTLFKKFWSTVFFYLCNDMDNINNVIFTYCMMFWTKRYKVRKTYLESGACVWNLNCCLQMFWSQQEKQKIKCQALWLNGKNEGLVFCFGILDFYEGFTVFFSLLWQFSLSKSHPLERVMEQIIYRWVCCGFWRENKWDSNLFGILFHYF